MEKEFSVKSKSFDLYKRFKEVCEKQGWMYNSGFTSFTQIQSERHNCLYFSPSWNSSKVGGPRFSLTTCERTDFQLESDFEKAVAAAQSYLFFLDPSKKKTLVTVEDFLKELPDGYRELALKNLNPKKADGHVSSIEGAIMDGFTWSSTPEGGNWWVKMHTLYTRSTTPGLSSLPPLPVSSSLPMPSVSDVFREEEKSIGEWYKLLPRGYRERAIRNNKTDLSRKVARMSSAVNDFTWSTTPEGTSFWSGVYNHYSTKGKSALPPLPENTVC